MLTVDSAFSARRGERQTAVQAGKSGGFSSMLNHTAYTDGIPGVHIGLAGVVEDSSRFFQIQYVSGSTAEDPIVRISGRSPNGSFDYVRHVRDLDPRNVNLPEAYALRDYWASVTGEEVSLPALAENWGDCTQRRDITAAGNPSLTEGFKETFLAEYARKLLEEYEESLLNICKA